MFSGFRFLLRSLAVLFALAAPVAAQTVTIGNGTAAAPTLRPIGSTTTGLFRVGPDTLGIAAKGRTALMVVDSALLVHGAGTASCSSSRGIIFTQAGNNDYKFTRAANSFSLCQAASEIFRWNSSQLLAGGGSAGSPAYSFLTGSDLDLGMYRRGADTLGFAAGGTGIALLSSTGFYPLTNGVGELGTSSRQWDHVRALNGTVSTLGVTNLTVSGTCTGCGGASFPLRAPNGTATAPSYSYTNATGAGHFYSGDGGGADTVWTAVQGARHFGVIRTSTGASISQLGTTRIEAQTDTISLRPTIGGQYGLRVTGSTLLGGDASMTIRPFGNSRNITLQATTSAGAVANVLVGSTAGTQPQVNLANGRLNIYDKTPNGADFVAEFSNGTNLSISNSGCGNTDAAIHLSTSRAKGICFPAGDTTGIRFSASNAWMFTSGKMIGGPTDMTIQAGTGASRKMHLLSTFASGATQTMMSLGAVNATDSMQVQIQPNGNVKRPSLVVGSSAQTGLYRFGADTMGFALGGNCGWVMSYESGAGTLTGCGGGGNSFIRANRTANVNLTLQSTNASAVPTTFLNGVGAQAQFPDGTGSLPSITFGSDADLGIYRVGTDQLGIVGDGGGSFARIGLTGGQYTAQFGQGNATTAGISFIADPNTGLFNKGADTLAITTAGTMGAWITGGASPKMRVIGSTATQHVTLETTAVTVNNTEANGDAYLFLTSNGTNGVSRINTGSRPLQFESTGGAGGDYAFSGVNATGAGDVNLCIRTDGFITSGATCGSSSAKVKTNIQPLLSGDLALKLRPVSYTYKTGFYNQRAEFGLIADEAAKVDPRFAFYADTDQKLPDGGVIKKGEPLNVNDRAVLAALLATVQAQQKKLEALCKAGITPAC